MKSHLDKLPDCECITWAWYPELGPWLPNGHHPLCNAKHDKETCDCVRCKLWRFVRDNPIPWSDDEPDTD